MTGSTDGADMRLAAALAMFVVAGCLGQQTPETPSGPTEATWPPSQGGGLEQDPGLTQAAPTGSTVPGMQDLAPEWSRHACDRSSGPSMSLRRVSGLAGPPVLATRIIAQAMDDSIAGEAQGPVSSPWWLTGNGSIVAYADDDSLEYEYYSEDPDRVTPGRFDRALAELGVANHTYRVIYWNAGGGHVAQVLGDAWIEGTGATWGRTEGGVTASWMAVSQFYELPAPPVVEAERLQAVATEQITCRMGNVSINRTSVGDWSASFESLARIVHVTVETPGGHCRTTTYAVDVDVLTHAVLRSPRNLCL